MSRSHTSATQSLSRSRGQNRPTVRSHHQVSVRSDSHHWRLSTSGAQTSPLHARRARSMPHRFIAVGIETISMSDALRYDALVQTPMRRHVWALSNWSAACPVPGEVRTLADLLTRQSHSERTRRLQHVRVFRCARRRARRTARHAGNRARRVACIPNVRKNAVNCAHRARRFVCRRSSAVTLCFDL